MVLTGNGYNDPFQDYLFICSNIEINMVTHIFLACPILESRINNTTNCKIVDLEPTEYSAFFLD